MKRHLRMVVLALATMASLTSVLSAQESWVRGGLNFGTITEEGSDFGDVDSRRGISLGLGLTLPVSGALAVQLDGAFTQKGDEEGPAGAKAAIGMSYVEFSSVLKASAVEANGVLAHIFAGPWVAFRVSCDVEETFGGTTRSATCDDVDLDVGTIDFGLLAGAGVDRAISETLTLSFDVLYSLGLTSIIEEVEAKHRVFTARAGVGFPLR